MSSSRFVDDLRASFEALRKSPWLPAMTFLIFAGPSIFNAIALSVTGYDPACYGQLRPDPGCLDSGTTAASGISSLISLPLGIFAVGWIGSERIWFMKAYRGQQMTVGEAFQLIWPFWGRYFRLGLIFAIGFIPATIIGIATRNIALFLWVLVPATLIFDFAMTFVTPALAYSTNSVADVISIGLGMIGSLWPRSVPYVFVPPLVLLVLGRQLPPGVLGLWGTTAVACVGALANLWFKGAVAASYLRVYPGVPENGSAGLQRVAGGAPNVPPPPPGDAWQH